MVRGSGAICYYLRQTLWKCEGAGSSGVLSSRRAQTTWPMTLPLTMTKATCQEGTLSEPQDVIPTKKRPRSSTPDTGYLRQVLADQMQMPLQTANRKFKFIEGDWFVRMPVSYSTSMHQKVWFV